MSEPGSGSGSKKWPSLDTDQKASNFQARIRIRKQVISKPESDSGIKHFPTGIRIRIKKCPSLDPDQEARNVQAWIRIRKQVISQLVPNQKIKKNLSGSAIKHFKFGSGSAGYLFLILCSAVCMVSSSFSQGYIYILGEGNKMRERGKEEKRRGK